MNKDIRGEIYSHLTLKEKMGIKGIKDPILNEEIIKDIDETWICKFDIEVLIITFKPKSGGQ